MTLDDWLKLIVVIAVFGVLVIDIITWSVVRRRFNEINRTLDAHSRHLETHDKLIESLRTP